MDSTVQDYEAKSRAAFDKFKITDEEMPMALIYVESMALFLGQIGQKIDGGKRGSLVGAIGATETINKALLAALSGEEIVFDDEEKDAAVVRKFHDELEITVQSLGILSKEGLDIAESMFDGLTVCSKDVAVAILQPGRRSIELMSACFEALSFILRETLESLDKQKSETLN